MLASFRNSLLALAVFACIVFCAAAAFAQGEGGIDPRASFSIGASLLGGGKTFFIGPTGFNTQYQDGARIAFRGTFNIREHFGVEGTYGFESDGLQVTTTTPFQSERTFGVHIHQLEGNGMYFFDGREHRFRPFVTAGLGILRYNPTSDAKMAAATRFLDQAVVLQGETHPDFVPGVGIEAAFTHRIGARFDFRDHITGLPRFGLPQNAESPNGPHYPVSGVVGNWEFSAGAEYHF